ncbi:MAG: hypothetical protein EOP04_20640 [Proteobacteria bacterium]|nr:MAG: hypothetical protein EOP04_20640 [Pseudomonadota bacterium]
MIDASDFSDEETQDLADAVKTWNKSHQSVYGSRLFRLKTRVSRDFRVTELLGCQFEGSSDEIHVYRVGSVGEWKTAGLSESSPAVTLRCQSKKIDEVFGKQVILLNSKDRGPSKREQFQSIVLHELGHAIGLFHSCESGGSKTEGAQCTDLSDDHPYKRAVMYPYLHIDRRTNRPEVKEQLTSNDEERARCIWGARR